VGSREVVVHPDAATLATEVAAGVISVLAAAQHDRGRAMLGLTAGSIMEQVWSALAAAENARTVDWAKVDVVWGDERFVPMGDADRNDAPAERLLFSHEPFSAANRLSMPASDGLDGADIDAAADRYATALFELTPPVAPGVVPNVDVMLLGIGPDGHCCSLFPGHSGLAVTGRSVIAVRESPKPPPLRLSLSFEGLNAAEQIWVVASGSGKAEAVAEALGGADRLRVPSAGAQGRQKTIWFLDADAAADLKD
jgi:6-phosphogluconolactonase